MTSLKDMIAPRYKDVKELPYRQGAVGIIIDKDKKFLVVQMIDYEENQWRFSGGGLEEGETHTQALLRELREELGSSKFEIVRESTLVNKYDWPEGVIMRQIETKNRYFRGREQRQFLVKFTGAHEELKPDPAELRQIKWIPYEGLESHFVFDNQWKLAEMAIKDLGVLNLRES